MNTKLWIQLSSFDNLHLAFKKAARGKRSKPSVADFEFNLESNILLLRQELLAGDYRPGTCYSFYIHDPKRRLISAAPFRDRVVHHALINVIEPIFEGKFIFDTYANRIGKGTHRALDRCTHFLRKFEYVMPLDVRQFFPSIDHTILVDILSQTITEIPVLDLCSKIIASGQGVLSDEYKMVYFPGDDLFARNRPRGLPIGNLTSQFWANVYLNGLDHFIKRRLECPGYLRFVDDMLLFSNEKGNLHEWFRQINNYLADLRLSLHINSAQPRPSRIGVPFLGFQVFRDHRRLKRRNVIAARRRLRWQSQQCRQGEISYQHFSAGVKGWLNHARFGDTWGLRKEILLELDLLAGG